MKKGPYVQDRKIIFAQLESTRTVLLHKKIILGIPVLWTSKKSFFVTGTRNRKKIESLAPDCGPKKINLIKNNNNHNLFVYLLQIYFFTIILCTCDTNLEGKFDEIPKKNNKNPKRILKSSKIT